jgi:hypothetical protein
VGVGGGVALGNLVRTLLFETKPTDPLLINMSLTVFNWVELVGHLPLYGVMAMLLVWTPHEEDQRLWAEGVLKK